MLMVASAAAAPRWAITFATESFAELDEAEVCLAPLSFAPDAANSARLSLESPNSTLPASLDFPLPGGLILIPIISTLFTLAMVAANVS